MTLAQIIAVMLLEAARRGAPIDAYYLEYDLLRFVFG